MANTVEKAAAKKISTKKIEAPVTSDVDLGRRKENPVRADKKPGSSRALEVRDASYALPRRQNAGRHHGLRSSASGRRGGPRASARRAYRATTDRAASDGRSRRRLAERMRFPGQARWPPCALP